MYEENDQVPASIRLPESRINILVRDSTLGNFANQRVANQHFFNFKDGYAVLLLQFFNELVFPDDLANDHRRK